ncbi:MAG: TerB family tellurite resistance protein [Planctomycetes bacterium]|nr:TerB family tellurite resistance protein [Planctomycetota bacterium]
MHLQPAERRKLLEFVCSFVWTDLKVTQTERDFVMRTAGRLGATAEDVAQVERWLQVPPPADAVDPTQVPRAHRQLFLQAADAAISADHRVVPAEREALALFRELLRD